MKKLKNFLRTFSTTIVLLLLVSLLLIVIFFQRVVLVVPPGYVGVVWYLFSGGTSHTTSIPEGIRILPPWDRLYLYDARLQVLDQSYDVISKDGLQFKIEVSIRWRLSHGMASKLHQDYGPEYAETLIAPEIGAIFREIISSYAATDLLDRKREKLAIEIFDAATDYGKTNGIGAERIILDPGKATEQPHREPSPLHSQTTESTNGEVILLRDVLIISVDLPNQIKEAVRQKLAMAQLVEEYELRIQREKLESERKAIEGAGIRKFQQMVTDGITEGYLTWRGIQATLELATSPNSKIIVIGGGSNGLPLILNTADGKVHQSNPIPQDTLDTNGSVTPQFDQKPSLFTKDLDDKKYEDVNGGKIQ